MDSAHALAAEELCFEVGVHLVLLQLNLEKEQLNLSQITYRVRDVATNVQKFIEETNNHHRNTIATNKEALDSRKLLENHLEELKSFSVGLIQAVKEIVCNGTEVEKGSSEAESIRQAVENVVKINDDCINMIWLAYNGLQEEPMHKSARHLRMYFRVLAESISETKTEPPSLPFLSIPSLRNFYSSQCTSEMEALKNQMMQSVGLLEACNQLQALGTRVDKALLKSLDCIEAEEHTNDPSNFEEAKDELQQSVAELFHLLEESFYEKNDATKSTNDRSDSTFSDTSGNEEEEELPSTPSATIPTPASRPPVAQRPPVSKFSPAIRSSVGNLGFILPGFKDRASTKAGLGAQRVRVKKKSLDTRDAETIVEYFLSQFQPLQDEWLVKTEKEKGRYLQEIAQRLEKIHSSSLAKKLTANSEKQLEELMRQGSAADLSRFQATISEGEEAVMVKKLAEAAINVIINSSLSVIDMKEEPPLGVAVQSFFSTLIETLKRVSISGLQLTETIRTVYEKCINSIEEKSHSESFCQVNEHITKAANMGLGSSKLIEYQMKINIWNDCNFLRILIGSMACILNACTNKSELNAGVLFQVTACASRIVDMLQTLLVDVVTTRHIMTHEIARKESGTPSVEDSDDDQNIWDERNKDKFLWEAEEKEKSSNKVTVRAGTLNKLVQVLTSDKNLDNTFLKTFITTYRSFTTPWKLVAKLLERYNVPKETVDEKRASAIQLRVAIVIKYWVETQFYDFDEDLVNKLLDFTNTHLPRDGHGQLGTLLSNLISAKVQERRMKMQAMMNIPPTDLALPGKVTIISQFFLNISDEEFARQLTLVDFNIYKSIQVQELLKGAWNSDKLKHRSPNVCALLDRLNKITMFVPSLILWQERKQERAAVYEKIVRVAQYLKQYNNYTTLMGIVAGLNLSCITRLKATLPEVDKKIMQKFQTLERQMDPSLSFKNYRTAFSMCKLPALPYIGVYLTDLIFIEDGNPDMVCHSKFPDIELINFQKRQMVYNVLQQIQVYQQGSYPFPILEPIHTLLMQMPHESEKTLYDLSLVYEPRNVDPKLVL